LIKVLIVDDEYLAREGMKRTVDWQSHNCVVVGDAEDGLTAIELCSTLKPELIITDINMPGINGLEMAEEIRRILPQCNFIIITGYDEFEYARAAVKIHAVDFLLKPVEEEELLKAIDHAVERCLQQQEDRYISGEKLLRDILKGRVQGEELVPTLNKLQLPGESFMVCCIMRDNILLEALEGIKLRELITKELPYFWNIVEYGEERYALVIPVKGEELRQKNIESIKALKKSLEANNKLSITVGISAVHQVEELSICYREAREAIKYRLYRGKGSVIFYEEVEKAATGDSIIIAREQEELLLALRACDRNQIEKQLKHIYFDIFKESKPSRHRIKQISLEIILKSVNLLVEHHIPMEKVLGNDFNAYKRIEGLGTLEELHQYVYRNLFKIYNAIREYSNEATESGIEKAIEYIKGNYTKDISLSQAAQAVYMNESYLSRRLKKVLGISYVEYITKLRMEKAMEYLLDPEARIMDVAEKLGYTDYRYFSQCFKKYTGYSPSAFTRNKKQ